MKSIILPLLFLFATVELNAQQVTTSPKTEFVISLSTDVVELKPGESKDVTISLLRSKSYSKLKGSLGIMSTLPEGVTVSYAPAEGVMETSVATVNVAGNAKPGVYRIILNGTINQKSKGSTLKLVVGDAAVQQASTAN